MPAPAFSRKGPPLSPICLWIVLPAQPHVTAGPRRLIAVLRGDPRYRIAHVIAPPGPPAPLPRAVGTMLGLELRALPPPDHAPPLDAAPVALDLAATDPEAPDVVIDFSWHGAVDPMAARARHGLWRPDAFAPQAGLHDCFGAGPVTCLRVICARAGHTRTIARDLCDTKPLASRTQAYMREKSVQPLRRLLALLHRDGRVAETTPPDPVTPRPPPPGAGDLLRYAGHVLADAAGRGLRRLRHRAGATPRPFVLALGQGTAGDFDPAAIRAQPRPRNTFRADPFLLHHDGETYCLFEEYDYRTRRGHIAAAVLDGDIMRDLGPVLRAPHHLSYPFVFHHGDDIFMIPETNATRRVEIWRAERFPMEWTLHATGLEGIRTADTTLIEWRGQWWCFTNPCDDSFGDFCNALSVFALDGPDLSGARAHALNPVVTGADRARNAGRLFVQDGRLFRLAQDNSGGIYGYGLRLFEITELSQQHYRETPVRHITPSDFTGGVIGCHHADACMGRVVIDLRLP
ncbi:MAG: hypothetical protein NXH82_05575 [Rhodobacteraceae bacterium]|nr:hypothetical protein [Paracoccaceae bacterium]